VFICISIRIYGIICIDVCRLFILISGAVTSLKVGAPIRRYAPENIFFWSCPSTFLALKVQLVVLVNAFDAFRDGQYSLVTFLFAVLLPMVPPCPSAICKSGRARSPVPHRVGATDFKLYVSMLWLLLRMKVYSMWASKKGRAKHYRP